jgi:aryl-alcohol dehydrogenase-like predicted oxidoreductase
MVVRGIEAEVVPYCMNNNLGILAYSPLQRGLLTGKLKPGHVFADGDHRDGNRYFTDDSITKTNSFLSSIKHIAETHDATFAQIVLAWTLEQPGITIALAGARNADQALQNAAAGDIHLTPDELAEISKKLDDSGL